PLQDITIHTLSPKTTATEITAWLKALPAGCEIGLVSEAGCPAVADPGAQVVELAHTMGITVQPWVGPSSILLGLMASGLSGQQFAFHGYAPIEPGQRAKTLKAWELDSARHRQTQMLIETPYRNMAMFATLLASLKGDTRLCIARSLTTPEQYIMTRTIRDWKKAQAPELDKQPTLFLFMAH
ncbi:MAG: SAM-dependent methyltransferase, partial [Burkholderiaceae bacterium]